MDLVGNIGKTLGNIASGNVLGIASDAIAGLTGGGGAEGKDRKVALTQGKDGSTTISGTVENVMEIFDRIKGLGNNATVPQTGNSKTA